MSGVALVASAAVGLGCTAVAGLVARPTKRLAPRVRPYALVARAAHGLAPDVVVAADARTPTGGSLTRLFGPPVRAVLGRLSHRVEQRGDEYLARLLQQADLAETVEEYRVRQLAQGFVVCVAAVVAVGFVTRAPFVALIAGLAGFIVGVSRARRRVERAVETRAARIRQELYTVNHLLAMHMRTGAGPLQAVQRVVERGRGAVVDELGEVLNAARSGVPEVEAFRAAAAKTPEPSAARTYEMIAGGVERGADLAASLLALSGDMRDARREQMHKDAVRRRAAMLIPTIAILAPIMLLFIAAPLPSIVLGHR